MGIVNSLVVVTTGATLLANGGGSSNDAKPIAIQNESAASVFWGGLTVTTTTGIPLAAGAQTSFTLTHAENLYAISTLTNASVRVAKGRS